MQFGRNPLRSGSDKVICGIVTGDFHEGMIAEEGRLLAFGY
jgi:alpha-tubulin suppressor-like RCC1 family protein